MASPAAGDNMLSTPPTTATGAQNPSPPTASSTQPNTQTSTQAAQPNGTAATSMSASFPSTSLQDSGASKRPRDARLIHLLLANMGVHAYTERVPLQLLDFAYRYTNGILSDATSYEGPALQTGKKAAAKDDEGVGLNALRTAIHARAQQQFSPQLPKEYLTEVAAERNRIALPRVERQYGMRLPPERYCFTGVGWDLKEEWEEEVEMQEEADGAAGVGGPVGGADTVMGGMEEEEVDEDEFEEVMGGGDAKMTNA